MRRAIVLAVGLAILLGFPAYWSARRSQELIELLSVPPTLSFQIENGRLLHDGLMDSDAWESLEQSELWSGFLEGGAGAELLNTYDAIAAMIEDDPLEMLLRMVGRRAHGAAWRRPTGGWAMSLIAIPEADTSEDEIRDRIDRLAATNSQIVTRERAGKLVVPLGPTNFVLGNGVIVLATSAEMGITIADEWPERVTEAPAIEPGIHMQMDPSLASAAQVGPAVDPASLALKIVAGGFSELLLHSTGLDARLVPVEGGVRLEGSLDAGLDVLQTGTRKLYGPEYRADLPAVDDEILRLRLDRNLDMLWKHRKEHLAEALLDAFSTIELQLRSPGLMRSIFVGVEPGLLLQVAPRFHDTEQAADEEGGPDAPMPAVAITARFRNVEELGPRMVGAFQGMVSWANEKPATRHQLPLLIREIPVADDALLVAARFAVPPRSSSQLPPFAAALNPASGQRGSAYVLSTSVDLAQEILERVPPEAELVPVEIPTDLLRLDARALEKALTAARGAIVRSQVESGSTLLQAEAGTDTMLALIARFESLEGHLEYHPTQTHLNIQLMQRAPDADAPPLAAAPAAE